MFENKLEQEIIQLYDCNLVNLFSINQISKKLNKKYPYINKKVSSLLDMGIMKKIVIGRSHLCSLNLDNEKTRLLLGLNEINKKLKIKTKEYDEFIEDNEDIDICSIIKSGKKTVFILSDLKKRRKIERSFPESIIIEKSEFLDLISEMPRVYENHTVIYGYEKFFELIKKSANELKRTYSPLQY